MTSNAPGRVALILTLLLAGCSPFSQSPQVGPDKQGAGTLYGAAVGAGTGAVTGAQLGAAAGPAAWVGAGLGSVFGMLQGIGIDILEDEDMRRADEERCARETTWAQEVLAEHYSRRLQLHPNRDIFPADLFFDRDGTTLRGGADALIRELTVLTKQRMPWSRIMIASYMSSSDSQSSFADSINQRRAEEIALAFVKNGFEPRRLAVQGVTIDGPLVLDPDDSPSRYRQAIEIIPLDY